MGIGLDTRKTIAVQSSWAKATQALAWFGIGVVCGSDNPMSSTIQNLDRMTRPACSTIEGPGTLSDQSDCSNAGQHLAPLMVLLADILARAMLSPCGV